MQREKSLPTKFQASQLFLPIDLIEGAAAPFFVMRTLFVLSEHGSEMWGFFALKENPTLNCEFLLLPIPSTRVLIDQRGIHLTPDGGSRTISVPDFDQIVYLPTNAGRVARRLVQSAPSAYNEYEVYNADQWDAVQACFEDALDNHSCCINSPKIVSFFSNKLLYYSYLARNGIKVPLWTCTNCGDFINAPRLASSVFKGCGFHNMIDDNHYAFTESFANEDIETVSKGLSILPCIIQDRVLTTSMITIPQDGDGRPSRERLMPELVEDFTSLLPDIDCSDLRAEMLRILRYRIPDTANLSRRRIEFVATDRFDTCYKFYAWSSDRTMYLREFVLDTSGIAERLPIDVVLFSYNANNRQSDTMSASHRVVRKFEGWLLPGQGFLAYWKVIE